HLTLTLDQLNATIGVLKDVVSVETSPELGNERGTATGDEIEAPYATDAELAATARQRVATDSELVNVARQRTATDDELVDVARQRIVTDDKLEDIARQRVVTDDELARTATALTATVSGLIEALAKLRETGADAASKAEAAQTTADVANARSKRNSWAIIGITGLTLVIGLLVLWMFIGQQQLTGTAGTR
ncbi:MAG: hypothetical protein LC749_13545, partial [Actinobacteria bacterium]|nr:hypothetical protein [Actinomycetota bacterium]